MKEIKLTIDGKEVQLTDEQLRALEIWKRKNPFDRTNRLCREYFYADLFGCAGFSSEGYSVVWKQLWDAANYFNDKQFAEQVALHQLLYRKLLKFAYDNECEDNQAWNKTNWHYYIAYNTEEGRFYADVTGTFKHQDIWFCSKKSAERAIEEVVKPFMKEHPEFVW